MPQRPEQVHIQAKVDPELADALARWQESEGIRHTSQAIKLLLGEILENKGLLRRASARVDGYNEGLRQGLHELREKISTTVQGLWKGR